MTQYETFIANITLFIDNSNYLALQFFLITYAFTQAK